MTFIGRGAFYGSSVEEVYFENSRFGVTMDDTAFYGCANLKTIVLPYGLTSIGAGAFYNCSSLESIDIPDTVTFMDGNVFGECRALKEVKLPAELEALYANVFQNCTSLTEVTLPHAMKAITKNSLATSFDGCTSLENIWVDADNTALQSIDGVLFSYNGKSLLMYPEAHVGTEYEIPEGVTKIGVRAFENNKNLEKVSMASAIERVGINAFYNCSNLKTYISYAVTAPLLECGKTLQNGDLQYGNFTDYYCEYGYGPDGYGPQMKDLGLTLYRPADSTGYEAYAWQGFFGQPNCQNLEMTPENMFAVRDLTVTEGEDRTAQLSWTAPGQAEMEHVTYEISRAVATKYAMEDQKTWIYGDFETLGTNVEETTFTDFTALDFGLTYAYRVAVFTDAGETGPAATAYLYIDADEENADEQAALNVIAAIEALKPVDGLGADDAERVEAVRKMYEALTDTQKTMVANYSDLLLAEDYMAAARVTEQIAELLRWRHPLRRSIWIL